MQAPCAFHLEARRPAEIPKCVACGRPLRGQKKRFCGDQCRSAADANARQAIGRVKALLNRRSLICKSAATLISLAFHLEALPESPGARREHNATVLNELDILLTRKGPNHADVRAFVRTQADAIRLTFEVEPSRHPDDIRHHARALEILRDSGLEDPEDIDTLLRHAWGAVNIYHEQRDWLNLARSLQALANTYRIFRHDTWAKRLTHYAWWILSEKFGSSKDSRTLTIVHHSALFDLRLFRDAIEPKEAEWKRQQIVELAERVDTPTIWSDTHQELAGYFGRDGRYEDQARSELRALQELQSENPRPTSYGATTLLRPEIEICFGTGRNADREKGICLIETRYLELYEKDRNFYSYRLLKEWRRKYNLAFDPPKPAYNSPLLLHLPR